MFGGASVGLLRHCHNWCFKLHKTHHKAENYVVTSH